VILDWIEEGMMDASFEEAAFSMSMESTISSVIRTDFGFHLIKLLEIEKGDAKPLEELKGQITTILQDQFIEDKFFDLKDSVSEKVFEVSDSLTEAADSSGLMIRKSSFFDRQFGIGLPPELQNQPAVLDIAFSEDVLYQGLNSELVELSDGNAVVLRLLEHKEAGITPIADVQQQIISQLTQQRAREAIENTGNEIVAALEEGQSAETIMTLLPEAIPVNWQQQFDLGRQGTEIDAQLRDEVFRIPAPVNGTANYKGILLGSGDYAVVKLSAVKEGTIISSEEMAIASSEQKFKDYHSQAEVYGYLKHLDAKASISRTMSNINQVQ